MFYLSSVTCRNELFNIIVKGFVMYSEFSSRVHIEEMCRILFVKKMAQPSTFVFGVQFFFLLILLALPNDSTAVTKCNSV